MRKIFIILCCFGILSAHATEMCARNDTVVIPLDATISSAKGGFSEVEFIAWGIHDYGTIYGAGACLSKKELMMYSNWNGTGNIPNVLNTADDELIGASGYYMNAATNPDIPDADKGDYERRTYCLKLIHPMSSNWYCMSSSNTSDNCRSGVMLQVSYRLYHANYVLERERFFNSIGTQPPWEEE